MSVRRTLRATLFPYTTLFRSGRGSLSFRVTQDGTALMLTMGFLFFAAFSTGANLVYLIIALVVSMFVISVPLSWMASRDRKSTRLNSSHMSISYAVFCLKKKN